MGQLLIAAVMGALIFCMMSNREFTLTQYGENSLYIFLFHGFFIRAVERLNLLAGMPEGPTVVVALILAVAVTHVLSRERVMGLVIKVLNPWLK